MLNCLAGTWEWDQESMGALYMDSQLEFSGVPEKLTLGGAQTHARPKVHFKNNLHEINVPGICERGICTLRHARWGTNTTNPCHLGRTSGSLCIGVSYRAEPALQVI